MKFRKGDLVIVEEKNKERIGIVLGDEKEWYCIKNHLDVRFKGDDGIETILDINDVISIIKREQLKEWWNFI